MSRITFILNGVALYTEKVLVEFEMPLLFICKDKSNKRYSVLCVDSDEERYLIVESRIRDIVQMIQNTITMKELFLKAKNSIAWMVKSGKTLSEDYVDTIDILNVEDEDLPADGAMYEIYNADIHDYVDMLLNRKEEPEQIVYFVELGAHVNISAYTGLAEEARKFQEMRKNGNEQTFTEIIQLSEI